MATQTIKRAVDTTTYEEALYLLDAQADFIARGCTDKACPRCGGSLVHELGQSWERTRCEAPDCGVKVVCKGI
jgi:hypothetical protein